MQSVGASATIRVTTVDIQIDPKIDNLQNVERADASQLGSVGHWWKQVT